MKYGNTDQRICSPSTYVEFPIQEL